MAVSPALLPSSDPAVGGRYGSSTARKMSCEGAWVSPPADKGGAEEPIPPAAAGTATAERADNVVGAMDCAVGPDAADAGAGSASTVGCCRLRVLSPPSASPLSSCAPLTYECGESDLMLLLPSRAPLSTASSTASSAAASLASAYRAAPPPAAEPTSNAVARSWPASHAAWSAASAASSRPDRPPPCQPHSSRAQCMPSAEYVRGCGQLRSTAVTRNPPQGVKAAQRTLVVKLASAALPPLLPPPPPLLPPLPPPSPPPAAEAAAASSRA